MQKGEIKSWGTKGDDLWVEGKTFVFRISRGYHLRPYRHRCERKSCRELNPWKNPYSKVWEGGLVTRPFFSFRIGRWGFYLGWKIYELDPKDDIWLGERLKAEYPYGQYLCVSARGSSSIDE